MDRSDFYYRQIVTQAEMDQAFDDVANGLGHRATDQDTWGVVSGYVVFENSPNDLWINISSGVAYDDDGNRIPNTISISQVLLSSLVPTTPGESRYVRMLVSHTRDLQDPRLDGNNDPVDYRQLDDHQISYVFGAASSTPAKPSKPAGCVSLAMVILSYGQTAIDDGDISMDVWNGDREDGGVVIRPGREVLQRHPIKFEPPGAFGVQVINLARNDMNADGGDIYMDDPATGGGGRIFMETGGIYKAGEVRAEGPPSGGAGFLYVQAGGAGDEFGNTITLDKWVSTPPDVMRCHTITYPKDPANQPTDWKLEPLTDTSGNLWPFNLFSPSTFDYSGHRWEGHLVIPAGNSNWIGPLHIPILGLPDGSKLIEMEVDFAFPDGIGTGDFLGVYLLLHKQRYGKTAYTAGKNDTIYMGPATAERNGWGGSGDPAIVADGRVRVVGSVASGGQIVDNEDWAYFGLLLIGGSSPGVPTDLTVTVGAAHSHYQIREASNVY